MNEMNELTTTFSILLIVLLPASAYCGYRLGYFRGYVAAQHLINRLGVLPARISAKKRFYALVASLEQKRVKIPFYGYFGEK